MAIEKKRMNHNLIDTLKYFDATLICQLFDELGASLPRTVRIEALRTTLAPVVKAKREAIHAKETKDDEEIKSLSQLDNFGLWTETQLEDWFLSAKDNSLYETFIVDFWTRVLAWLDEKAVDEALLESFVAKAATEHAFDALPDFKRLSTETFGCFYDESGTLEGLDYQTFRNSMREIGQMALMVRIAKKYGLTLSRTMNKTHMRTTMKTLLEQCRQLTETLSAEIDAASINELETLATKYKLPLKSYLTKIDMADLVVLHVRLKDKPHKKTLKAVKKTEPHTDLIERLDRLENMISRLEKRFDADQDTPAKQKTGEAIPRPSRSVLLDVVAGMFIFFLFIGLISYFLDGLTPFNALNNLFNRVTYREYGLMELYHTVIDFIIRG